MYELFVLGQLLESPKSGYEIRSQLQNSLGPHRQISYGVLYPLLEKMQQRDYIGIIGKGAHSKKIYEILPVGRKQFQALMEQPVGDNAHNEDLFLIKIGAIQHVAESRQLALLDEYLAEQNRIVTSVSVQMRDLLQVPHHGQRYAYKILELQLARANATIKWINVYKEDINGNVQAD